MNATFQSGMFVRFRRQASALLWFGYPFEPPLVPDVYRIVDYSWWHDGGTLYGLRGIEGHWTEDMLEHALSEEGGWYGPVASQYYRIESVDIGGARTTHIRDPIGKLCLTALGSHTEHMFKASTRLSCWEFEQRFCFEGTYDYGEASSVCWLEECWGRHPFIVEWVRREREGLAIGSTDGGVVMFYGNEVADDAIPIGISCAAIVRNVKNELIGLGSMERFRPVFVLNATGFAVR